MSPLPTPKGNQQKVVHLSSDRHHIVLGTAGTGKSTMAMLRALHLARPSTENFGPVLVVTYNNTLVTYLKFLGPEAANQITIETYGKFARGYLNSVGLMSYNAIAKPQNVRNLIIHSIHLTKQAGNTSSVLDRDIDWLIDEIHWISGMGIFDEESYQTADRVGRQTSLPQGPARSAVWTVCGCYLKLRADAGYTYDWYDIATAVREAMATDTRPRRYKHIIIDEGQDLSPEAIRSLTTAIPAGGSLTFFGDYHQAIYGQGLSWRRSGINLDGRPVARFVDNLRNTAQIAGLAIAMADSDHMNSGDIDLVAPTQPTAAGPPPVLVRCSTPDEEVTFLRTLAADLSKDQRVAILGRTWVDAERVAGSITYTKLNPEMHKWDDQPGLFVGAYHSAKGLEFGAVIMPFMNDDTVPHPDVLDAFSEEEACAREARLLYVALTRARVTLVMSYSGTLTRLLPANTGLWTDQAP